MQLVVILCIEEIIAEFAFFCSLDNKQNQAIRFQIMHRWSPVLWFNSFKTQQLRAVLPDIAVFLFESAQIEILKNYCFFFVGPKIKDELLDCSDIVPTFHRYTALLDVERQNKYTAAIHFAVLQQE